MTHDELLAKIEENRAFLASQVFDAYPSSNFVVTTALRAVVEFHKPWTMQTGPEGDSETEAVIGCECIPQLPAFLNPWPCPTVQIIENELNDRS